MIFAVDFDGTLVTNAYPNIGEPKWDIINFCKKRQKLFNDIIILWTCRTGRYLEEALHFLTTTCDFIADYVNENAPYDKSLYPSEGRKIGADYYIDDKAISVYDIDKLEQELNKTMENDFLNKEDKTIATNKSMTSKELEEYLNNINSSVFQTINSNLEDWKPYLGKCPHCGSANIEANYNIVLTSMPPQYNCRCKNCSATFYSGQITQESQTITPYNPDPGLPNYPNQPQKPQYDWGNIRQGWICPRCGKVNSPDRDFCDCSSSGGWGSPIIWCNSQGTSAGKTNTTPNVSISGSVSDIANIKDTTNSTYNLEACNLNENKGDLK